MNKWKIPYSLARYYALIRHITDCSDERERQRALGRLQQRIDRLNRMLAGEGNNGKGA